MEAPAETSMSSPPTLPTEGEPVISEPLPLLTRIRYGIRLWSFKLFVVVALGLVRRIKSAHFKSIAPTYTKRYKSHPSLECRVFIPQKHKPGSSWPLYINIHGGGFALCDPQTDDQFCRYFADQFGYCIVSINYRKAPAYPFPYAVDDCVDLARDALADQDLPVNHDYVAMGGFSAGANLSLAIAQYAGIKEKVKAIVPYYPVVDFSGRDRGEFKPTKDGKEDMLKKTSAWFNWGYVPQGIDRRDKRLSVAYATRDDLPQKIYFVGAEYDYLHHEANMMAKRLAGHDTDTDAGVEWFKNGVKWELVPDVQHGFTHVNAKGEAETKRVVLCNELYQRIDRWLRKEAFQMK